MITIDLPLILTASFFFIISFAYGWGLLTLHRNDFAFDLVSTVGILCVVSCTFVFVWLPRIYLLGYNETLHTAITQFVIDLAFIFLAALPGMSWVRWELQKDEKKRKGEIIRLRQRVVELCHRVGGQNAMMDSIEAIIRQEGERSLQQIIKVLELQGQSRHICYGEAEKQEGLQN